MLYHSDDHTRLPIRDGGGQNKGRLGPSILYGQPDLGQLEGYLGLMALHCKGHEDSQQPSVHLDSAMGIVRIACEGLDRPRPNDPHHHHFSNPDVPGFGSLGSCYG